MHVSNLFTPCIIKDRIGWQRSCYQLTKTIKTLENQPTIHFRFHKKGKKNQKYEKRHHLTGWNVCKWCAMSHRMIPTVHLYWMMHTLSNYKHDTYTVLLELKYWAGDNQSSSKILLQFWSQLLSKKFVSKWRNNYKVKYILNETMTPYKAKLKMMHDLYLEQFLYKYFLVTKKNCTCWFQWAAS